MSTKKVSGKTHTKEQLDNWANQNNPNNPAYWANRSNHAVQLSLKHKTHQQTHNARRRHKGQLLPYWAPDYPDFDE